MALVGFLLMSWFSTYVQFCYCNAYVQLDLLVVKCLLDYTYLSRQTNKPIASAFKTILIVVLLIFVCLLSSELMY